MRVDVAAEICHTFLQRSYKVGRCHTEEKHPNLSIQEKTESQTSPDMAGAGEDVTRSLLDGGVKHKLGKWPKGRQGYRKQAL